MIKRSYFGQFGGRFVPETLMPALQELEREYKAAKRDKPFRGQDLPPRWRKVLGNHIFGLGAKQVEPDARASPKELGDARIRPILRTGPGHTGGNFPVKQAARVAWR